MWTPPTEGFEVHKLAVYHKCGSSEMYDSSLDQKQTAAWLARWSPSDEATCWLKPWALTAAGEPGFALARSLE